MSGHQNAASHCFPFSQAVDPSNGIFIVISGIFEVIQQLLIVVGNSEILQRDPHWGKLLMFCVENGAYVGPPISVGGDGPETPKSALARSFGNMMRDAPAADDDDDLGGEATTDERVEGAAWRDDI